MADFELVGGGADTVLLLKPQNDDARQYLDDIVPDDAQFLGESLAIENKYVMDFCVALMADGFNIAHQGHKMEAKT